MIIKIRVPLERQEGPKSFYSLCEVSDSLNNMFYIATKFDEWESMDKRVLYTSIATTPLKRKDGKLKTLHFQMCINDLATFRFFGGRE